ncbi:MAG: molybdopterin synthase sulfur carrier subunit, partial [Chloroflexi bacterium]|nr:molybdopterin synthase sulfur carrier subunit [Chloroflexota bacterium]
MAVKVKIPTPLRNLTQNQDTVEAQDASLGSLVETLEGQFPGMRERLLDEGGEIRRFVNIYVNGEDVRFL